MKVIIAKTAGFCEGVEKALKKAFQAARKSEVPVYTLGPLVHNPQVTAMLEERGVKAVERIDQIGSGTVVIRSHGVPPAVLDELQARGLEIIDATCRRVAKVHGRVQKYHRRGYLIVVLGDKGHAEVQGIQGYADNQALVISTAEDVKYLPRADKVCLVAQTTQDVKIFNEVTEALPARYPELDEHGLVICDTICRSTRERQEEVIGMAREVEALVVVGGKDSANTARLRKVAEESGIPAFHVETAEELDLASLRRYKVIGLTAGASTPDWVIEQVKKSLEPL